MPAGLHTITPSQSGKAVKVQVLVDRDSAAAMEKQREAIVARGNKLPYFDFNHGDDKASFWPSRFVWRDGPHPGVFALGKWTKAGREAIEGHEYRQFSPVFFVDDTKKRPARVVCNPDAGPNFGGFLNDPAFADIAPLWAKQADDAAALVSKAHYDALRVEMDELLAKHQAAEAELAAKQAYEVDQAIKAAIARGAIAPRDMATQERFIAAAKADPTFIAAINGLQGNMALMCSGITKAATNAAVKAGYGERTPGAYRIV